MDFRVSVDFAGGGQEEFGACPFGQAEHVDRAEGVGFDGLHRIVHVVRWGRRRSQVVNFINWKPEKKS